MICKNESASVSPLYERADWIFSGANNVPARIAAVCLPTTPTVLKSLIFSGPDCYSSYAMLAVLLSFLSALCSCLQSRACLQLENHALRHQINVLRRGGRRLLLKPGDRLFWVWLARFWKG
jgi:hypothetical protein